MNMKGYYKLTTHLRNGLWALLLLAAQGLAAQNATISGHIRTPWGAGIEEVTILVDLPNGDTLPSGPTSLIVQADGSYSISLPIGSSYRITPLKDDNPLNGVTTYDLVLIAKHYLGVELLNSPYKIIAADADQSGTVDVTDSLELRKLILGIYTELPNNHSWRFVRADYLFPDPTNPFVPPFPESAVTGVLTGDIENLDFIGVKIGDVNGSAIVTGGGGSGSGGYFVATGWVRADLNDNCEADTGETPLENWLVTAQGNSGTYYATSYYDGQYFLFAPTGVYDVFLTPPNGLWAVCTDTISGFTVPAPNVDTLSFSAQALFDCPRMEVDLSAPVLVRCFSNNYYLNYCNQGTVTAHNASVEVTFDPYLEVQSSSPPWSSVSGNTYTFNLSDVAAGECGHILFDVVVSCEAELGQSHCSVAHVYPDTLCGPVDPEWSGANLEVTGECQGDEVVFTVTNTGDDMTEPAEYIVIEDIMILMVGNSIQLNHDETETITVPANGSTWRLEVDQAPNHPLNQLVSAMVEGCGVNGQGAVSLGIIPLFPTNDAGVFEDEDCLRNVGSYDPNDKQGFPLGVGADHMIPQEQEIEYLVRFQNTGTYAATNVIVLDTLDASLDVSTLRPGSSSHPYEMHVLGSGVLQFVFENIMLPDSNANEPGSHGFFQFAIQPKAGLQDGTVIKNEAAIYFDFNLPVITNQTRHTLGSQFLNVSNVSLRPGLALEVFPNPASRTATFSIQSARPNTGLLRLYDLRGALVRTLEFDHNQFELDVKDLQPGLYFFRLDSTNGEALAAGKLVVQHVD